MQENNIKDGMAWHRNGRNLHINLQTEPDTATLASMSSLLKSCRDASGRVFVDVRSLNEGMPARTIHSLKYVVSHSRVPAQSVYFKGPMGFTLASDGNRVIIVRARDEVKQSAAAQAKDRVARRPRKCSCGGGCGDKCCQVTGGPCCGGKGHHHHDQTDQA